MLRVVEVVAVLETANLGVGWMGSCLALASINAMEELARRRKAVPPAIRAKLRCVPFLRDLVRGGKEAPGPSSAAAAAAASLEVEVAGRRRALPEAAVVEVLLRTRRSAEMSSSSRAWTTSRAA